MKKWAIGLPLLTMAAGLRALLSALRLQERSFEQLVERRRMGERS
jgi:hypothetical protein